MSAALLDWLGAAPPTGLKRFWFFALTAPAKLPMPLLFKFMFRFKFRFAMFYPVSIMRFIEISLTFWPPLLCIGGCWLLPPWFFAGPARALLIFF
jgi:hypothetical protein|tara:strand:+ start:1180 stop:1464 length:285 start_codon:yes stop_codon:yes gene_type:complete